MSDTTTSAPATDDEVVRWAKDIHQMSYSTLEGRFLSLVARIDADGQKIATSHMVEVRDNLKVIAERIERLIDPNGPHVRLTDKITRLRATLQACHDVETTHRMNVP